MSGNIPMREGALRSAIVAAYPISLGDVAAAFGRRLGGAPAQGQIEGQIETVLFEVRLPRVLAAALAGAALAAAGAAYQMLFRNPLVSPDILGVSTGAGLGAVLGIFLSLPVAAIQLLAFAAGLATVGLVWPAQAGEVRLDGAPLASLARRAIARRVAYVPQAHAAHFPFSVIDMVVMGRTVHLGPFASPSETDRRKAAAALATLGIANLAEAEYTRISGGQRQLALIARSLAQKAPAIVMDEPTASLDFGNQVLVLAEIRRLAASGLAIVLSTHDPDHAFSVASRVALLHGAGWWPKGRRTRS